MGDTKMNDGDDLIDCNEVDPEDLLARSDSKAPEQGGGKSTDEPDWTFDDI